jgi:hypothetical protein
MKIRVIRILVPPLELILRLGDSLFRRALTSASPRCWPGSAPGARCTPQTAPAAASPPTGSLRMITA